MFGPAQLMPSLLNFSLIYLKEEVSPIISVHNVAFDTTVLLLGAGLVQSDAGGGGWVQQRVYLDQVIFNCFIESLMMRQK